MINLTTDQKVRVVVVPLSANGKPARVDGVPGWAVSDPSVASLEVDPDGMAAYVFAVSPGNVTVSVSADADLSTGVREIVGSVDVTVVEAEADSLTLEADEPVLA